MQLEQRPPNGPNFKLIGILVIASILAIFVVAVIVLRTDKHLAPKAATPTGQRSFLQLVTPARG